MSTRWARARSRSTTCSGRSATRSGCTVVEREPVVEAVVALAERDQRRRRAVLGRCAGVVTRLADVWASELMQNVACSITATGGTRRRTARPSVVPGRGDGHRQHEADPDRDGRIPAVLDPDAAHRPQVAEPADVGGRHPPPSEPADVREPEPLRDGVRIADAVGVGVWARWSALHDSAEFWNVAAAKTSSVQRSGAVARYVRWANRRWYPAVIASPHTPYRVTASTRVAHDGRATIQSSPTSPPAWITDSPATVVQQIRPSTTLADDGNPGGR